MDIVICFTIGYEPNQKKQGGNNKNFTCSSTTVIQQDMGL